MKFKYLILAIVLAGAFLIGYGAAARAWPGVPDRDRWRGYFTNDIDDQGDPVILGGYPGWVNNGEAFIGFLKDKLYNGSARDSVGAAFTIQTMRGASGGWSRNYLPTPWEVADWEGGVRYAESRGWITWVANFTYSGNSYWQGNKGTTFPVPRPDPNDDAFYYENGTRISMIFRNSSGVAYVIKRDCANPLTYGYMPGLERPWSASGRTTVSSAMAVPGQTVTFQHYVRDDGPTSAQMWWGTFNSPSGTGISSGGPDIYVSGQERNVISEDFTIPANAAANTPFCRLVGWDPVNSSGARNGRGAPACVTVFIPAKLKAVMAVNPANAVAGETVTFTPSITTVSSGNPATVNCTITRAVVPPAGAPTNLGAQPCVDTAGNANITVNSGGAILRPNAYVVPDNLAVGSKVCDTITITNPTLPIYFNSNADRAAVTCVTIAKTPYVRFMGNDVFAGGNFAAVDPACNTQANITTVGRTLSDGTGAGSVGEYGVFALGKITAFGSSSKVLIGSGALGDRSRQLTFANSEVDATKLGYFGASHCITDYTDQFSGSQVIAPPGAPLNVGTRGSGAWHITGALSLHGTMPAGGQQVYYADGDVTITADLKYPDTYANINAIPSLLIITKGNIYVQAAVGRMDGTFLARGNGTTNGIFYTCYPKNEPAAISNACNNTQLVVNGSVSAAKIDLFRSFGATGATSAQRKDPAEQFNFSPEMYMRSVMSTSQQINIQTINVLDLPPRF